MQEAGLAAQPKVANWQAPRQVEDLDRMNTPTLPAPKREQQANWELLLLLNIEQPRSRLGLFQAINTWAAFIGYGALGGAIGTAIGLLVMYVLRW